VTRILWSPQALLDLESIRDYIAHDSEDLREIIVEPYRIVCRLRPGVAEIVTVFRVSRLFPDTR